jgi:hypothetical protein
MEDRSQKSSEGIREEPDGFWSVSQTQTYHEDRKDNQGTTRNVSRKATCSWELTWWKSRHVPPRTKQPFAALTPAVP